jgi:DNA polymerase II large subunit
MLRNLCVVCREEVEDGKKCARCGKEGRTYSSVNFPLKFALEQAKKKLGVDPQEPFKGVKSLMSAHRSAEPLEKGILRQKHDLHAFKVQSDLMLPMSRSPTSSPHGYPSALTS